MPEDRYIKSKEAAKILGLKEGTLANWRHKRKGPKPYKIGRYVRYLLSEVLAWPKSGKTHPEWRGEGE